MGIVLYSTGCPKCKVLTQKLDKKGIVYEVKNDVDEMLSLGLKAAPGLKVGDTIMGFTEAVRWVNEHQEETDGHTA